MDELFVSDNLPEVSKPAEEDALGLDQTIKIHKSHKIAKIDNDRLLNKPTGLKYIIKNHPKLIKNLKNRDSRFNKKIQKTKFSSSQLKNMKLQQSYDNLELVLHFYQLWCHSLFPKANFKDCIQLLRNFGSGPNAASLKIYRKGLIEKEINDYKRANGIIVHSNEKSDNQDLFDHINKQIDDDDELYADPKESNNNDDEDDWSFMNVKSNDLFVGNDYPSDDEQIINTDEALNKNNNASNDQDDFSDDEDILEALKSKNTQSDLPDINDLQPKQIDHQSDDEGLDALRDMDYD